MSLDNALFLVNRAGTNYRSKGSDIGSRMVAGDSVLVQRNGQRFKATFDGSAWTKIQDSDLLLTWDGTSNRRVTGANFKALFGPKPKPPVTESEGFGIIANKAEYQYQDFIQPIFIGMKPGYTQEDYIGFYKTIAKVLTLGSTYLTTYPDGPNNSHQPHSAYWKYDKVPVQSSYQDVTVYLDFQDRETGEVIEHSMRVRLLPRT